MTAQEIGQLLIAHDALAEEEHDDHDDDGDHRHAEAVLEEARCRDAEELAGIQTAQQPLERRDVEEAREHAAGDGADAAAYARSCVCVLPENVPEFFYILAHTGCVERMAGAKKMLSAAASRSAALEISGHVAAAIARRVEGSRTAMLDSLRQALPLIEAHDMPALLAEHWGWFENETAAAELSPWAATLERVRALSRRYYAGLNALVSTDTLTERELMIYLGIAHGLRYEEICTVLNITRNTLKTHLKHLFIKFAVSGREELEQRLAVL